MTIIYVNSNFNVTESQKGVITIKTDNTEHYFEKEEIRHISRITEQAGNDLEHRLILDVNGSVLDFRHRHPEGISPYVKKGMEALVELRYGRGLVRKSII